MRRRVQQGVRSCSATAAKTRSGHGPTTAALGEVRRSLVGTRGRTTRRGAGPSCAASPVGVICCTSTVDLASAPFIFSSAQRQRARLPCRSTSTSILLTSTRAQRTLSTATPSTDPDMSAHSLHELTAEDNQGHTFDFSQLKGKVVLVVNVASKCGFTPQYKNLQALYDKFKDQGLEIVAFPCNQFGGQEPGSDAEIQEFCQKNYGVNFPVMKKIQVNGDDTHPVYVFLKNSKSGILGLTRIKWNFEKFLVDKDGTVVDRYSSLTSPDSLEDTIQKLLKA